MRQSEKIPVSVLVAAKNEGKNLPRCLEALLDFAEVIVINSQGDDLAKDIAEKYNAKIVDFEWNGAYPKKRQWCIDTQKISHDWVLWIDADEVVTTEFAREIHGIAKNNQSFCGCFVGSRYVWGGGVIKHGLKNSKLAFYNKHMVVFPVVDDLDIDGMGEIEGHYQPVKKTGYENKRIGQVQNPILHYAYEDFSGWEARHERYANWEARMIMRGAYPKDPVWWREALKRLTRKFRFRGALMFVYVYFVKLGFLDGKAGFAFALSRKVYCDRVVELMAALSKNP